MPPRRAEPASRSRCFRVRCSKAGRPAQLRALVPAEPLRKPVEVSPLRGWTGIHPGGTAGHRCRRCATPDRPRFPAPIMRATVQPAGGLHLLGDLLGGGRVLDAVGSRLAPSSPLPRRPIMRSPASAAPIGLRRGSRPPRGSGRAFGSMSGARRTSLAVGVLENAAGCEESRVPSPESARRSLGTDALENRGGLVSRMAKSLLAARRSPRRRPTYWTRRDRRRRPYASSPASCVRALRSRSTPTGDLSRRSTAAVAASGSHHWRSSLRSGTMPLSSIAHSTVCRCHVPVEAIEGRTARAVNRGERPDEMTPIPIDLSFEKEPRRASVNRSRVRTCCPMNR